MNPLSMARRTARTMLGAWRLGLLGLALSAAAGAQAEELTIDSRDFIPLDGSAVYQESSAGNLTCSGGSGNQLFIAQLPLPPAPTELDLKQVAIWGGDFSSLDTTVFLVRSCQSEFTASQPVRTVIAQLSSSGNGGNYFDFQTLNRRVDDQQTCVYMFETQIGVDGCAGANLSLARVRVRYDLVQQPVIDAMFTSGFEN